MNNLIVNHIYSHNQSPDENTITHYQTSEYPLSSVQQAIWLDQTLNPDLTHYNIGTIMTLKGDLDTSLLEEALKITVQRYESFKLRFSSDDCSLQYLTDSKAIVFEYKDFRKETNSEENIEQ